MKERIYGAGAPITFIIHKTGEFIIMMGGAGYKRYTDPFTDYGFKMLFGQRQHKRFLIPFLNGLLRGSKVVKDLIFRDKEQLGLSVESRKSLFDIYCEDEHGHQFVIELQRKPLKYFTSRAIYYSAYPIIEQGVKGEWDHQLKQMHHIWIMDHVFPDSDPNEMMHEIKLMNTGTGQVFDNSLTYLFIEMPKFTKKETELETALDKWLFVLTNLSRLKEIPLALRDDPIFKDFFMVAELLQMTQEEKAAYLISLKEQWDDYSYRELVREQLEEIQETKRKVDEAKRKEEEATLKLEEAKLETEETTLKLEEVKLEAEGAKLKLEEVKRETERVKREAERVKREAEEAKLETEKVKREAEEAKLETEKVKREAKEAHVRLEAILATATAGREQEKLRAGNEMTHLESEQSEKVFSEGYSREKAIAANMKALNLSSDIISKSTGLSTDEIEKL